MIDQARIQRGRPGLTVAASVASRQPHTKKTLENTCGKTTATPDGTRPIMECTICNKIFKKYKVFGKSYAELFINQKVSVIS